MKATLIFCTWIASNSLQAQINTEEINEQVWKPFLTAYTDWDSETFNALHKDEMIRVTGGKILNLEQYKKQNIQMFEYVKKSGYSQAIQLRFEERLATTTMAYETGYYKIRLVHPDGKESYYYGRFHVTIKKNKGTWKIVSDWDSSTINGVEVNEADFNKLEPFDPIGKR